MNRAELNALVRADRAANAGYLKSRIVLRSLRHAQYWRSKSGLGRVVYVVSASWYKLTAEWILGIEIPVSTVVGPGLRLRHGVGIVINPHAVIGANVMIRQGVTIGNRREADDTPVIGDAVEIGAGAVLAGDIAIGDRARIAPGVLVMEDVPADFVVMPPRNEMRLRRGALRAVASEQVTA